MQLLRRVSRIMAIPISLLAFLAGIWGWSFWWFLIPALLLGIAMADQRIGIENPLDVRNFIPGPRRDDFFSGIFAFGGALLGFAVMYIIGGLLR